MSNKIEANNQDDYRSFSNRVACQFRLRNVNDALDDARQCVSHCPALNKGYYRAGKALEHMGRHDDARTMYQAGIGAVASEILAEQRR